MPFRSGSQCGEACAGDCQIKSGGTALGGFQRERVILVSELCLVHVLQAHRQVVKRIRVLGVRRIGLEALNFDFKLFSNEQTIVNENKHLIIQYNGTTKAEVV